MGFLKKLFTKRHASYRERVLSRLSAEQATGDTAAPPSRPVAPLSEDTINVQKLISGVMPNPDAVMAMENPANRAYLRGYGLYEEMIDTDPHLRGLVSQRQLNCLASPSTLTPGTDTPFGNNLAAFVAHLIKQEIDDWEEFRAETWFAEYYGISFLAPEWVLRDVAYEVVDGVTDTVSQSVLPAKLYSRRRGRFIFNLDSECRILTQAQPFTGETIPPYGILDHAPRKRYENPYGEPLAKVLYRWAIQKRHCAKWKIADIEKHGSPTIGIPFADGMSDDQLKAIRTIPLQLQHGSGFLFPQDYPPVLFNPTGGAGKASPHLEWAEYCDKQIAIAILGQTLTSQQGDRGSQALGRVHAAVLDKIVQADADHLAAAINRLIRWIVELNFGASALQHAPVYSIDAEQRDVAAYLKNAKDALSLGLTLSIEQIREETLFAEPKDPDDTLGGKPEAAGGDDDDDPDGDDPQDRDNDKQSSRSPGNRPHGATIEDHLSTPALDSYDHHLAQLIAASAGIPAAVSEWVIAELTKAGQDLDAELTIDPATLPWHEFELPEQLHGRLVDTLNNGLTVADLLGREDILTYADDNGIEARATRRRIAGEDDDDLTVNPLAEALFGKKRIIPHDVLSVHNRRVRNSVSADVFYRLDSVARGASFTAWDLATEDIRHIGGGIQDALNWGYSGQQFSDYVYTRLAPRYIDQGDEMHAWHVRTIWRTGFSSAYNTAKADTIHELRDVFEYVEFFNLDPQTPCCVERAGKVYRVDSGFMTANKPPLHFGCGSTLRALSREMVEDEELAVETAMPATPPEYYAGPKDENGNPLGNSEPFGGWLPLDERYAHLEQELARVRGEE